MPLHYFTISNEMSNVAGTGSRPTATRYMTERKSSLLLHANEVFYSWQYSSHVTSTCHAAWFSLPNDFPTPPASCGPECSRTGTNTVRRNTPHTQTPFCPLLAQPRWARIRKGFRGFTAWDRSKVYDGSLDVAAVQLPFQMGQTPTQPSH